MYKKFLISIVTTIFTIIAGITGFKGIKPDNSVEMVSISNEVKEENTIDNTLIEEVAEKNEEPKKIPTNENDDTKIQTSTQNNVVTATKSNTKVDVSKNTKVQNKKNGTKVESVLITKDSNKNTQEAENKMQEEQKKEEKTEEYVYNDTATNKIIADINEIAKRNKDLWGTKGEKLYKIEKSASLIGKNYMSPYRKAQVEGIVLNVFPVKFLVYAVDYKRTGFTTETRYYIDIANY